MAVTFKALAVVHLVCFILLARNLEICLICRIAKSSLICMINSYATDHGVALATTPPLDRVQRLAGDCD
jgi:hypothetical protein